ncbi:MAG: HU family DNA-binding protein [Planctomycetota bacterium]|nr:HU family DNA-binding protein [Planctomycetota bacterium]
MVGQRASPSGRSPRAGRREADDLIGGVDPMATVTKKDLIDRIAETTKQKRVVVKRTVQKFLNEVILELGKGNRLEFRDFGVFEIRERKPRTAQNPKTLERVAVPPKKVVKFKVGRLMQKSLEDPEGVEIEVETAVQGDDDRD